MATSKKIDKDAENQNMQDKEKAAIDKDAIENDLDNLNPEDKPEISNPEDNPEDNPADKPAEDNPEDNPADNPADKPADDKPDDKPEDKPELDNSETANPKNEFFTVEELASLFRVPSWQLAALTRLMDWEDGKMLTNDEFAKALEKLTHRKMGYGA